MSSALAVRDHVEPQNMTELKEFARMAAASRFFGAETPEQALILAMAGRDLGFSYTQALRAFYVVKGRPTLSADGMVAACVQHSNICEYFRPVRVTETEAVWVTKPKGGEPIEYRFTMEDANRAGLVNDMYRKHPKRMLSARCKSYLARDVYPHLLMGLITEDEAEEIAADRPARTQIAVAAVDAAVSVVKAAQLPETEPVQSFVLTEAEVTFIKSEIDASATEAELKKLGPHIANTPMSPAQNKDLRAHYAIRRAKIRKLAREAAEAANADADPQDDAGEGEVHAASFDE